MIIYKVNTLTLKSGTVQIAYKKLPVYHCILFFSARKCLPVRKKMMGNEKDKVLEKIGWYFVIVGLFVFTKVKLSGGLICFCSSSYSSKNHKEGVRAAIPGISVWPPHATHSGSTTGQKTSATLLYSKGCGSTQYKQIYVLQRENYATCKVGT